MEHIVKKIILVITCLLGVYFAFGAYLLSSLMPRYLFPPIAFSAPTEAVHQFEFYDAAKNQLLVREYGREYDQATRQCLVFFPGRHGGVNKYEQSIFSAFQKHDFKVFSFSYPGQDGALGQVEKIASLVKLIEEAMQVILLECLPEKTIVYGRSLGATVAIHSISNTKVSGFILESVAPALSIAVNNHFNSTWYLKPLTLLPIALLLPKDYDLNEPLAALKTTPVSIFQGANDLQTPLSQLQQQWTYASNVSLHIVKTGEHSNTYSQAINDIVNEAKNMLVQP